MGDESTITRRSVFAGGAGAVLAASFIGLGEAAESGAAEPANVKIVNDHLKSWGAADATGAKLADAYSDDCVLRFEEGKPPITGKAAAIATFDGFLAKGVRFDIKVKESFARGPVVANSRVDTEVKEGKPGKSVSLVGVFIVHHGKIVEWSDYLVKA